MFCNLILLTSSRLIKILYTEYDARKYRFCSVFEDFLSCKNAELTLNYLES